MHRGTKRSFTLPGNDNSRHLEEFTYNRRGGSHSSGQVREMSLPATPPPNQLLKSSPGPPRSPPAPLQPQNAETVEVSDSGDSDNEDLKKAKQLSNSRKAPNFLTFNFPVNISSILQ